MPRKAPRRRTTYSRRATRSFGNVRIARPSREYVQIPVLRGKAQRRAKYSARVPTSGLPRCTQLYAKSILDPSGEESKGACMPAGFPMPSQKLRAFVRGVMALSPNATTAATTTNSIGFISWRPVLANDLNCVTYTDGSFPTGPVNAGTPFNSPSWTVVSAPMPKLQYNTAQFTAKNVEGRMVSGCLRVRYASNENIRSGIVSLFEDPDHLAIDAQTLNTISLFDSCGKERPNGDGAWHQINWSGPAKQAETEYVTQSSETVPVVGAFAPACVVICISQADAHTAGLTTVNALNYEFECWQNMEYIGRDVPAKTNNEMDPAGSAAVWSAAKIAQSQSDSLQPNTRAAGIFQEELRKQAGAGLHAVKKAFAPKVGGSFGGNLFNGVVSAFSPRLGGALMGLRSIRNPSLRGANLAPF